MESPSTIQKALARRGLDALVYTLIAYYFVAFLLIVAQRVVPKSTIEINEDICLDLALRAARHEALFPPASADFIPSCYPGLYFQLSGLALRLFGGGLPTLRLISIASTLLTVVITYWCTKRALCSTGASVVCVGLFIAAFEKTGYWYDLARVDMLCLLLLVVSFWLLRSAENFLQGLTGAAVLAAAVLTKHTALLYIPAFALLPVYRGRIMPALPVLFLPPAAFLFHAVLLPGSWEYLVAIPGQQGFAAAQIEMFLQRPFPLLIASVLAAAALGRALLHGDPTDARLKAHLSVDAPSMPKGLAGSTLRLREVLPSLITALIGGIAGSIKIGGSLNHFIPLLYFDALILGIAWDRSRALSLSFWRTFAYVGVVLAKLYISFFTGSFALRQAKEAEGNLALIAFLKALGRQSAPAYFHGIRGNHLGAVAGYKTLFNFQSLTDLQLVSDKSRPTSILAEVERRLADSQVGIVVVRVSEVRELGSLHDTYERVGDTFQTTLGLLSVWAPKSVAHGQQIAVPQ